MKHYFLKEYLPEKLFTIIYLAEKCKSTTQYFWKKKENNNKQFYKNQLIRDAFDY